jgi:hypothetical protein
MHTSRMRIASHNGRIMRESGRRLTRHDFEIMDPWEEDFGIRFHSSSARNDLLPRWLRGLLRI